MFINVRESVFRFAAPALLLLATLAATPPAPAMSVQAPTFAELVAEAATVARARVTDVSSRAVPGENGTTTIKTFVNFTTITALKGEPPAEFTLAFLGGEADGERWTIPGMPTFAAGDEEFVFTTENGRNTICPLVGAMHGRYRVLTDRVAKRRYVARDNFTPLTSPEQVAKPMADNVARIAQDVPSALSPEEFENQISAQLRQSSAHTQR